MSDQKLKADFNGIFGDILCLSHEDFCLDSAGTKVPLREGMSVTAYDEDANERGERDDLIASGIVQRAPENLKCQGSRWVLKINENGIRHESEL